MSRENTFRQLLQAQSPADLWQIVDTVVDLRSHGQGHTQARQLLETATGIVLYGAGEYARAVLESWRSDLLAPLYLVDSNPQKWGTSWCGFPVLAPAELAQDARQPLVVVAAMDTFEIARYLTELQINHVFAERDGTVGFLPGHTLASQRPTFQSIYEGLADDRSRQDYLSIAKARLFQDFYFPMKGNWFAVECATHPQYFVEDIIPLQAEEKFVDCGAYDGDTVIDFAAHMWRKKIPGWQAIAIEADSQNIHKVRTNLAEFGLAEVKLIHGILGETDRPPILPVHNCRGGTVAADVPMVTLDEVCQDFAPTYIKMDIEGAELAALRGASQTLKLHCPKLAVCIYHQTSDLLDIPGYLKEKLTNYRFYIRHHRAGSLWETVCYAIPT